MMTPAFVFIGAVALYPIAQSINLSFRGVLPAGTSVYVGLDNYFAVLRDPDFIEAARTTVLFTLSSAGLSFLLGLGIAVGLNRSFRGRRPPRSRSQLARA